MANAKDAGGVGKKKTTFADDALRAIKRGFNEAAKNASQKKRFNAQEAMAERKAKAMQGKKPFNAQDAMKERREKAMAGKTPFNAQEEMKKRREAAQTQKRLSNLAKGR